MPFQPPWTSTYQEGDLLSGLEQPRKALIRRLGLGANLGRLRETGLIMTSFFVNRSALAASDFAAAVRNHAFLDYVAGHPKYCSILGEVFDEQDWSADPTVYNRVIRRKSKAGLSWIINSPAEPGKRGPIIHFCLTGINMNVVVDKCGNGDVDNDNFEEKIRSITGAELRWLLPKA